VEAAGIVDCVKPIRTDFKGYEGKYVATDTRTGQIVIADENLKVVLKKARKFGSRRRRRAGSLRR
jgi:hypothetical protein